MIDTFFLKICCEIITQLGNGKNKKQKGKKVSREEGTQITRMLRIGSDKIDGINRNYRRKINYGKYPVNPVKKTKK